MTRYGDRETRAEVASRAATRLPAAVRPVTGFNHARVAPAGWFSHPRAENGSLTYGPISPRPRPRSQANMWSSSPPGGAKSPGATAPRIPAPRDPVRRRPRPRRPRPVFFSQAFFSSVTVTQHARYRSMGGKFPDGAARRRASRPTPTHETPGDPRRELITNRAIERDRRIRLRGGRTRARASAPRGGVPHRCPGCRASPRPGDWAPTVPPTGTSVSRKKFNRSSRRRADRTSPPLRPHQIRSPERDALPVFLPDDGDLLDPSFDPSLVNGRSSRPGSVILDRSSPPEGTFRAGPGVADERRLHPGSLEGTDRYDRRQPPATRRTPARGAASASAAARRRRRGSRRRTSRTRDWAAAATPTAAQPAE